MIRLCKECDHAYRPDDRSMLRCGRPRAGLTIDDTDLVNGGPADPVACHVERYWRPDISPGLYGVTVPDPCGKDGRHWIPARYV